MTSMFFFGPNDRIEVDDFRPEVHDSDGLGMLNGRGETLWRPLNNPRDLQISSFADVGPRGFGLIQRQRDFSDYQDLESNFEKRPSLWVEPIGDWGEGSVQLLEIPTKEEIHDNISAFWHPKARLQAKAEHSFTYRLHWGQDRPVPPPIAKFSRSAVGMRGDKAKLFVLDLAGSNFEPAGPVFTDMLRSRARPPKPTGWSPDGREITFNRTNRRVLYGLIASRRPCVLDVTTDRIGAPEVTVPTRGRPRVARPSPAGRSARGRRR